ncbi:MAG: hypothetical protein ACK5VN_09830 [Phycisphaerae bacterium]
MQDAPSPSRESQLEAVLGAALSLLSARHDQMVTIDDWTTLARAVAACQGRKTAAYLSEDDLDEIASRRAIDWDEATDGVLPAVDE